MFASTVSIPKASVVLAAISISSVVLNTLFAIGIRPYTEGRVVSSVNDLFSDANDESAVVSYASQFQIYVPSAMLLRIQVDTFS